MKILISWIANTHDFSPRQGGGLMVNPNGTLSSFYEHLFDYDEHILLSASKDIKSDIKFRILLNHLEDTYRRKITPKFLDVDVISIEEIMTKLAPVLADYIKDEVEIYISPGTPSMQTSWYLLASEFSNVKLFQIRPPQFRNPPNSKPVKEFVEVKNYDHARGLIVREQSKHKEERSEGLFITDKMREVYELADLVASTHDVTTLILGETGTGKERLAQRIHEESLRHNHKFIAINCAALGDDLLESRLFGHLKGMFSGAIVGSQGAFREAEGGTIFLDEIGDISPRLQKTLLRVLQERQISPIGTFVPIDINVRIIAGTHRDLWGKTERGEFRADLFYRLAIAEINSIPVRELSITERKDLFNFFIQRRSVEINESKIKLSKEVEKCLLSHPFPGNFREVENLIESFYAKRKPIIEMSDIPERITSPEGSSFSLNIKDAERNHIKKVLKMFSGNKKRTAGALGISTTTLDKRINEIEGVF